MKVPCSFVCVSVCHQDEAGAGGSLRRAGPEQVDTASLISNADGEL